MSARYGQKVGPAATKKVASSFVSYNRNDLVYVGAVAPFRSSTSDYIRPSDYLPITPPLSSEQKTVLLVNVFNIDSNLLSFSATGNYKVDWGDGSAEENINSGVTASRTYNYAALPATPTSQGFKQVIVTITPQAGQNLLTLNLCVIHPSAPAANIYAQPIEEIYVSGPNLTSLTIGTATTLVNCRNASYVNLINCGSITSFSGLFHSMYNLQKVDIGTTAAITTFASMFQGCTVLKIVNFSSNVNFTALTSTVQMFQQCSSLETVPLFDTFSVTNMQGMFSSCASLKTVPLYNTANVTNMVSMFGTCRSLITVPLFNTANVLDMTTMFTSCTSLATVPPFITTNVTNMSSMFFSCATLKTVPFFNTVNVTTMANMFNGCAGIAYVPLFNTINVTNMSGMFGSCNSLLTVPLFNTANVTDMANMFVNCNALRSFPLFDTGNVTTMANMFNGCYNLKTVPEFNYAKVTNVSQMFSSCVALKTINNFNVPLATNFTQTFASCTNLDSITNMFAPSNSSFSFTFGGCNSLASISMNTRAGPTLTNCKLSKQALETLFTTLSTRVGVAGITITNNIGALGAVGPLNGTPVDGSTVISMASTTGLSAGMQVTGTNTSLTTGRPVTFTDAGDLVTLNNHGLSNGDEVSFSVITTTTGILINTIYFVVGATTNTFQLASSVGGAALPLTTNGSGTVKYNSIIVSIVPNTSVTMSRPMFGNGASQSLSFLPLQTYRAVLKGFAITI